MYVVEQNSHSYIIKPCTVCGEDTSFACSDCSIDSGGKNKPHVCTKPSCQAEHDEKFNHKHNIPFTR